jgi:hypothetical protein
VHKIRSPAIRPNPFTSLLFMKHLMAQLLRILLSREREKRPELLPSGHAGLRKKSPSSPIRIVRTP